MAPTFLNLTLPVTMLVNVVIPILPDSNITSLSRSVIQSPQQSQPATLPDGYVAHPDIGVAYKIYSENVTWSEARRRCISAGAHLAEIDTLLKYAYLMTNVNSEFPWTGIHKMPGDTEWVSSRTGLTMTSLPWGAGEPSGDYYCVFVSILQRGLRNTNCNHNISYACELPIPENYNTQGIDETVITGRSVIQSPQQSQPATLPDGYVAHPDIGAAYKVHDEKVTWKVARRKCISEGAHLADIDTLLEYEYLMTQIKSDNTWTGIYKMHGDTEWVSSSTGLTMTTLPWQTGEPSGDYYCVYACKSCGGLRNNQCDLTISYVCELPIPENYNAQGIDELGKIGVN